MAFQIDAVTFHPYYDGLPINQMTKWGAEVVNKYKKINPKIKLLVTEHGRWPADSPTGDWKDNWYQASGSGGAISTADYVLSLINDRSVAGAMWHSIAVESPWQLFHLDRAKDSIYPSGVYFGLLVLRNGFLDTSVLIKPSKITTYAYSPQQDLNMAAMKNSAGLNSILGVNRGAARLVKFKDLTGNIVLRNPVIEYMSADSSYSDNTDENKSRVSITSSAIKAVGQEYVCIPSRSVFNIKYK
ncbi:hypothetical protein [Deefgea sp. CFH1-16]|uniref:hypothetical protein n=1 Tax=Deefgea sp. CFH1-16 TaxID=2675457 RepID=UPI0015F37896|nr:hypothetical protein [Deefgea sp. CFH1-16]MBM5574877.1 hypothetical protein [Deefgea sp. CFH1-16]